MVFLVNSPDVAKCWWKIAKISSDSTPTNARPTSFAHWRGVIRVFCHFTTSMSDNSARRTSSRSVSRQSFSWFTGAFFSSRDMNALEVILWTNFMDLAVNKTANLRNYFDMRSSQNLHSVGVVIRGVWSPAGCITTNSSGENQQQYFFYIRKIEALVVLNHWIKFIY